MADAFATDLSKRWDRIALVLSLARAWEHWQTKNEGALGKRGFAIEWALKKAVRELNEEFPKPVPFSNPDVNIEAIIACAPEQVGV